MGERVAIPGTRNLDSGLLSSVNVRVGEEETSIFLHPAVDLLSHIRGRTLDKYTSLFHAFQRTLQYISTTHLENELPERPDVDQESRPEKI